MLRNIWSFLRHEAVLSIAALCAVISLFFVPPDAEYLGYIDLRVLCLLFCLMAVVAGFQSCGLFDFLARKLLSGRKPMRLVSLVLVLLPFFCSMLITNDVALITFVPFTILVLNLLGRQQYAISIIVLQTVAANLGSMATPVGNPQNLFLYANYALSPADFFSAMLPLTLVSLVCLAVGSLYPKSERIVVTFSSQAALGSRRTLVVCIVLFVLCLLSVFRVLHYGILTALVAAVLLVIDRRLLCKVDYSLLCTFVCFFIFAGNIGRIPAIRYFLQSLLEGSTLFSSVLASQVISNVPAAVLLSGFTEDWNGLLLGTNIGGLGAPIASLASLISLKLYLKAEGAKPGRFLLVFTIVNLAGLAVLLPLSLLL